MPFQDFLTAPILVALAIAFAGSALLVATRSIHLSRSAMVSDTVSVQAMHADPTPRIGGIAIFGALLASLALIPSGADLPPLIVLGLTAIPVFLSGLAEDLRLGVPPWARLAAAALSGALAVWVTGAWLSRIDLGAFDMVLAFAPVGVAFTIFASSGLCHAFNLVDGMNGLSATTAIGAGLGLAAMASSVGQPALALAALCVAAVAGGFAPFNFPRAHLFMGDAGAYAVGHLLAWIGILLAVRSEAVAAWAVLLVFFWPVADTMLALWRRRRAGRPAGQPDRLHFHQLVLRFLELGPMRGRPRAVSNPLTTLLLAPLIAAPIIAGVALRDSPLAAMTATFGFALLFVASYRLGIAAAHRRFRSGGPPGVVVPRFQGLWRSGGAARARHRLDP